VSERQRGATLGFVKAHAYGNDFLFIEEDDVGAGPLDGLARAICRRQHGIGADGLIVYRRTPAGATMRLFNADGSRAELSGNGVRCLGALLVETVPGAAGAATGPIEVETAGGVKTLELLDAEHPRYTFRAGMGQPLGLREEELTVGGELVRVVVLSVGNPQCVVLSPTMDEGESRFRRLGHLLATHDRFPEGTNVEFATVERRDRIRILIWERGVGPTLASGTGACAAAVAAARYGGAARSAEVVSPGGAQRVDWTEEEIRLTGWADVVARGRWIPPLPSP
jgi:diaminopimelate epimerase